MLIPYLNKSPKVDSTAFIAPDAKIIGDVSIAKDVSVFFGTVLRGDILGIRIGEKSNLQEQVIIHTSYQRVIADIGSEVTVGHRAIIHGAKIQDRCIIGMGSIILDEAIIGEESIVGAGAVVKEGMQVPPRSLLIGVPARIVRKVTDEELEGIIDSARRYVETGKNYKAMNL